MNHTWAEAEPWRVPGWVSLGNPAGVEEIPHCELPLISSSTWGSWAPSACLKQAMKRIGLAVRGPGLRPGVHWEARHGPCPLHILASASSWGSGNNDMCWPPWVSPRMPGRQRGFVNVEVEMTPAVTQASPSVYAHWRNAVR
jgi:hypothetical protein